MVEDKPKSDNIIRHNGDVGLDKRCKLLGQEPRTVWLTGLSASGKSTIAYALEKQLINMGYLCYVLDGDNLRHDLNRDLGFSIDDRYENIRRVAEVARLINDIGVIVITSFISPFADSRRNARKIIGKNRFVEVFVDTPLEVCRRRDPKGLYTKAKADKILEFTGISSPYEPPEQPDLRIFTPERSVAEAVEEILHFLKLS